MLFMFTLKSLRNNLFRGFTVVLLLLLLRCRYATGAIDSQAAVRLRLMSFNTWHMGSHVTDGLQKIANQIHLLNPDVVALQETYDNGFRDLLKLLGSDWTGYRRPAAYYSDVAIVTRHRLNQTLTGECGSAIGSQITAKLVPDKEHSFAFWSVHADYRAYGPYATCDPNRAPVLTATELQQMESGRLANLQELHKLELFKKHCEEYPVFVLGDFNAPSHLDWDEDSKSLHCNWTFTWPVSKLMEDNGFRDSFREVHNNSFTHPGTTWSPVVKYREDYAPGKLPEPQDRIDFIYYKGSQLKPVYVWTHANEPDLEKWPSDHASVVADFDLYPAELTTSTSTSASSSTVTSSSSALTTGSTTGSTTSVTSLSTNSTTAATTTSASATTTTATSLSSGTSKPVPAAPGSQTTASGSTTTTANSTTTSTATGKTSSISSTITSSSSTLRLLSTSLPIRFRE